MECSDPKHPRRINAIHPQTLEIERAYLLIDHFGRGAHAVNFGGANSANFFEGNTSWDLMVGETPLT